MKRLTIAIDGYSSCGKSTLAKDLAKALNYLYIDSGAMYRAVSLYILKNKIDFENDLEFLESMSDLINIEFKIIDDVSTIFMNGLNVEGDIRSLEVSDIVSEVATISPIRRKLVTQQKELGLKKGIVMDGRDIGTVVFPNADLKIFLTADLDVRSWRRFYELQDKGVNVTFEEVKKNLLSRDKIDSNRKDSPLRKADDALLLDNSKLDKESQLSLVLKWAHQIIQV